jgi:threonine dehydrogenase-like Zn-dependent dehydrogenase
MSSQYGGGFTTKPAVCYSFMTLVVRREKAVHSLGRAYTAARSSACHSMSRSQRSQRFDLAVVGAGIIGLAMALTYASAADRSVLIDAPEASVRIAIATFGAGASTGFAIGEELVSSLFERGVTA